MIDKDLFLYDLAITAIMKNEGRYLKEWLDYHLAAGVEHVYLYDNDSTDNQAEVAKPYVKAGLVDYILWPGKAQQFPVYNDAVKRFEFQCRYMAFIDGDEFIYPKTGQSIPEAVDEILSQDVNAGGLAINWQIFGSNGQEKADYSRGVLERFTRRAKKNWVPFPESNTYNGGNAHVKAIANPRRIKSIHNAHGMGYFEGFYAINENGGFVKYAFNSPVTADKIAVNHYASKTIEEFSLRFKNGRVDNGKERDWNKFKNYNRNEEFDDSILAYRDARAKIYQPPTPRSKDDLIKALEKNLPSDAPLDYYAGRMETFLTCRAVAAYLGDKSFEEASLKAIVKTLETPLSTLDKELFKRESPKLLQLDYPVVEELHKL